MTNEERKQIAYQIAYDAIDLFDEGWRATDREELQKRYDLTDWEADVMAEALEKLAAQYVQDEDGRTVDYAAAKVEKIMEKER